MFNRIGWTLLFILALCIMIINVIEMQNVNNRVRSLESKMNAYISEPESAAGPAGNKKGYELTIDMWQTFEKELQDYKQNLRDGKQQFTEQQSAWNSLLADLKKNLQEYDKFIASEGDFWEKQLKNYDRLQTRAEERFEILGRAIEELQTLVTDMQNYQLQQGVELKEEEKAATEVEKKEYQKNKPQVIAPKITGTGDYMSYPSKEEKKEETSPGAQQDMGVIRGTVSGTGEYQTY